MRYFRMLTNSVVGGLLVAAYLAVLVLQLNPHLSLRPASLGTLAGTLAVFYGVHLAVAFYGLIVIRQLLAAEVFSPAWLSVRVLAWLAASAAAAASALMWINLRGFGLTLDEEAARRMAGGAAATTVCAIAILAIAVLRYSFGRWSGRLGGVLLTLAVVASIAAPLVARGPGAERPLGAYRLDVSGWMTPVDAPARVVLLVIDGASLDYISPGAAEGRLPNFGRILDRAAAMHLATLRPTQPAPVLASIATGKYPSKHGVRSAAAYHWQAGREPIELLPDLCYAHALVRLGFLRETPSTSASLRARPLWSILSGLGVAVGVVGWPLTSPAQPVLGYLVSDRLHVVTDSPLDPARAVVAYPPDIIAVARAAAANPAVVPHAQIVDASDAPEDQPQAGRIVPDARDALYARIAADLQRRTPARFVSVRYQGLDSVGHRFLRYAMPSSFGDVSDEERVRHGDVLERYYRYIDGEVGQAIAALGPDDLLLVVSGFGMEPVSVGKRLLARVVGDPDLSGTHERAPDGFMLAYGAAVEPVRLPRGSVVDVAPTVLYFLGLPVGRDVDGYARTDVFRRTFTSERPITFIPTYER